MAQVLIRNLDDAEKKILQLAEATPAEKYAWRPAEKIRSTGEVFMHVAGGNYFLPTLWGGKMPEGVNPREFDKSAGDKAKVIETLKKSFAHAREAINAASDADLIDMGFLLSTWGRGRAHAASAFAGVRSQPARKSSSSRR